MPSDDCGLITARQGIAQQCPERGCCNRISTPPAICVRRLSCRTVLHSVARPLPGRRLRSNLPRGRYRFSRQQSSFTANMRNLRDAPNVSDTKSSDPFDRQVIFASPRGGVLLAVERLALVFVIHARVCGPFVVSRQVFLLCRGDIVSCGS